MSKNDSIWKMTPEQLRRYTETRKRGEKMARRGTRKNRTRAQQKRRALAEW